jgi:transcriptional regulator with XRE-family HTH domain
VFLREKLRVGASSTMGVRTKNKPYSEFGKVLDALAQSRGVEGPYNITHHIESVTAHGVSGQALSKYLYGKSQPKQRFIKAFADAFELTPQEQIELAWVYAYGFPMPQHEEEEELPTYDGRLYVGR